MKSSLASQLKRLARLDAFSPLAFVLTAAALVIFYAICELAGLREDTTFLSGTVAGGAWATTVRLGTIYLVAYFGCVLAAPIFLLAAGLLTIWQRLARRPITPA